MKSKKIIFLIPTLTTGGGERVLSELSLNMPDYIETIIVLFKNEVSYPYKGRLVSLGLPLSNSFLFKIHYFFVGISRFKKIIKTEKPDYVISFSKQANIINVLAHKKALLRIDNFMSSACKGFEGRIYKIFIKLLFNRSFQIISVSKKATADLVENFGIKTEKFKVIYNPLNIKKIQELATEPLESKYQEIFRNPVIVNMGRLTKQKGQWYLIRAFQDIKNRVRDVKLVILGQGELEQQLRKLIKDLNLEKDIYLLAWQENPFKFLAKSKVFVLSSLWEGLPYAVLEAMACGLPVVSVDCKSGPREILAPNTDTDSQAKDIEYAKYGILTPAFDGKSKSEKKLSKAIVETLTRKDLSDGLIKKSKQRSEDFDIEKIIKDWSFLWTRTI